MPKLIVADPTGTASILSMEAIAAIGRGDTALAQQKHGEAGDVLERRMKAVGRAREKHYLRFLAATQFYKGGHYQRAAELAEKIDPKLLDAKARELLPQFLKDVRERSAAGYLPLMRAKLNALWSAQDWQALLTLLAEHQYLLTPGGTAWTRGVCCQQTGKWKASAAFFARALGDPDARVFALDAYGHQVFDWVRAGQRQTATEYASALTEKLPNAVTFAAAAFATYAELVHARPADQSRLADEQIRLMESGIGAVDALRDELGGAAALRQLIAIAAGASAMTARWVGDAAKANQFRDFAVRFALGTTTAGDLEHLFAGWGAATSRPSEADMKSVVELVGQVNPRMELPNFPVAA